MENHIDKQLKIAWVAGLFEGEGSFGIYGEKKSKKIEITSTDLDVLEKVKEEFGGNIHQEKSRNPKWKIAYKWYLGVKDSVDFILRIYPYLGKRRQERADKYLLLNEEMIKRRNERILEVQTMRRKVSELREEGLKHREIAKKLGIDRTYVTKILNGV